MESHDRKISTLVNVRVMTSNGVQLNRPSAEAITMTMMMSTIRERAIGTAEDKGPDS
jgi:hypothetical protein